jgi:hypothetical protein
MPLSQFESIFFGALSAGLVVGLLLLFVATRKRMRRRFERTCLALGLTRAARAESACEALRPAHSHPLLQRWFGFLDPPVSFAHGTRDGLRVELLVSVGGEHSDDTTAVAAIGTERWPKDLVVCPSRGWQDRLLAPGVVRVSLIGPGTCQLTGGEPADLRRLLSPEAEAALAAFPREVREFAFRGSAFVLTWKELEQDPQAIEDAFGIALICLRAAARATAGEASVGHPHP